ncbi:hypothetical protein DSO57_1023781 [Entomophthora muscae]|uniref:Uncharacterized protein n=1 Tax=Entomophthora muscae TaxID=34485 RepID=A0ACC2U151_9FUNG|nr:hypothetical protein DSO57_1023781 [Entomophthora muscae]
MKKMYAALDFKDITKSSAQEVRGLSKNPDELDNNLQEMSELTKYMSTQFTPPDSSTGGNPQLNGI